jgi:RimJ/RimL family protein N-acetyltransferase
MRLRAASSADVPAIVDVQHAGALRSLTHIFPQDTYPFPRAAVESRWLAEVADPDVAVYVIERDDGRVAGFAAVRGNELLHFGTAVQMWGTGLAATAHDLLIEEIRATDEPHARLRVFVDNHRARRFYDKLGWRCTGLTSRSPFPPYPALVEYRRDL